MNLFIRNSIILLFICQITIFLSSCSQNTETKNKATPKENTDCKLIQQYRQTYQTKLNKEVKAPQGYGSFDEINGAIKLIQYTSENRALQALLDTTNIEAGVKKKAVVFLHGGFSLGYGDIHDCKKFTEKGYIVLAPSYRGENGNPGNYELFMGEVTDAKNAVKWLAEQNFIDKDSIYVFGHSIGGGLSLSLSLDNDIPVVLGGSCAGIYDFNTFEIWFQENENKIPFDFKNELETSLRLPVYHLECMERQHFMYIGKTDEYFIGDKNYVEKELYPEQDLLLEFKEVEGDHFSSLEHSIDAFIKQIEQ